VLNRGWKRTFEPDYIPSFDRGTVKLQYTFRFWPDVYQDNHWNRFRSRGDFDMDRLGTYLPRIFCIDETPGDGIRAGNKIAIILLRDPLRPGECT
jgi:hypothetical protein